ncbi:MAG: beta-ketoacyl-ACP synthase II [Oscillospiraceae bacterium]|nr:beta-ketoacyl-ACP synthase II [Oscillospiraceae bacterium]
MRRVVVTGLGAITPIGNDVPAFWQGLISGTNGIDTITRFDTSEYKVHLAAEVRDFDPTLYMEKAEVRKTDLFVQYGLAAVAQAMAESGLEGQVEPSRFGVYFGSGIGGIGSISNDVIKLQEKGPRRVSPHCIPMMIANLAGGHMAIRYQAKGSCLPVTTACATSTNAIGEAVRAIRHGYLDAVISGGSEASIVPIGLAGFANMTALTQCEDKNMASVPFDKRRSGFVMGEGAAALILEEYEHAKARGAKIYCEVVGYGTNCDAYHITAPDPEAKAAAACMQMALDESGLQDETRVYINAHGTSTPLNDVMETQAIKQVYGERAKDMLVSSIKSMVGHTLGAAGAVEAVAAIMAMQEGLVPPTIGLTEPDPDCDLDYVPLVARKADIRLALSTSFGFGGHNACLAFGKI